ncbi:MAG: hypothetical protein IIC64_11280 [SAR324 cluster bacterium]|nr:hypothetical protein [SAR324 cluster bacterium]
MTEEKKPAVRPQFASSTAGTLAFEVNLPLETEIRSCIELVAQLRKDYEGQTNIAEGLEGIENELRELRASKNSEEEIRASLESLMEVSLGEGKTIRLDAFRQSAAKSSLKSEEDYVTQVGKMLRNTRNNVAMLMLQDQGDEVLTGFMRNLESITETDYKTLKPLMGQLAKSPELSHYNEKKQLFLADWLRPFQDMLDLPIDQMTEEEFQEALKKVEDLRNNKLEEMTHMMVETDRKPFYRHNRTMSPLINGKDDTFWGGPEVRDEFLELMNRLITRFSFSLEDRFLIFRTKERGFTYLFGFADEAFDEGITTADGKISLCPHLKVFLQLREEEYSELTLEMYNRNAKAYYSSLKTAVVPFLQSAATMVETELSEDIKRAFDMWM